MRMMAPLQRIFHPPPVGTKAGSLVHAEGKQSFVYSDSDRREN